jgi:hypothetical protein
MCVFVCVCYLSICMYVYTYMMISYKYIYIYIYVYDNHDDRHPHNPRHMLDIARVCERMRVYVYLVDGL